MVSESTSTPADVAFDGCWASLSSNDVGLSHLRLRLAVFATGRISAHYKTLRIKILAKEDAGSHTVVGSATGLFSPDQLVAPRRRPEETKKPERAFVITFLYQPSRVLQIIPLHGYQTHQLIVLHDQYYPQLPSTGTLSQFIDLWYLTGTMDPRLMNPYFTWQGYLTLSEAREPIRWPDLPESNITELIAYAASSRLPDRNPNSWLRSVLSYGLVSRKWLEASYSVIRTPSLSLDLFGETIPLRSFLVLVQIALKDEAFCRNSLIRLFPPWMISRSNDDQRNLLYDAFNQVLRVVGNIRILEIVSPNLIQCQEFLKFLGTVEKFTLVGSRVASLSITTALLCIRGWRNLRTLQISGCTQTGKLDEEISIDASYSLKHLFLSRGEICGRHLLQTLSQSAKTLTVLRLDSLSGLTRKDFLPVLRHLAQPLEALLIDECEIQDDESPSPDTLFPVDAVIPDMNNLTTLRVPRNLASVASISKAQVCGTAALYLAPYKGEELPDHFPDDLLGAIRLSKWGNIYVVLENMWTRPNYNVRAIFADAFKAAKGRDIRLRLIESELWRSTDYHYEGVI